MLLRLKLAKRGREAEEEREGGAGKEADVGGREERSRERDADQRLPSSVRQSLSRKSCCRDSCV